MAYLKRLIEIINLFDCYFKSFKLDQNIEHKSFPQFCSNKLLSSKIHSQH